MTRRNLLFARALLLRCPHCGGRGVLRHWLAMNEACPTCGLSLATGNRAGAYLLNLFASEMLLVFGLVVVVVRSWPNPPYDLLQWLAPSLMLLTPLLFYPFSKLVFVAIDLALHPDAEPDVLVHGAVTGKAKDGRQ
jgi:uncharacterized protein (DUF983 family)